MARDPAPPVHPHDRALLKPLAALGKPTSMTAGVSFLRRTEYISSTQGPTRFESSTSKDLLRVRNDPKRKRKPNVGKDDPINILRSLVKGFDIAYPHDAYTGPDSETNIRGAEITDADLKAWSNPKHPTKPDVTLVDSYPVLPDLDALPGTGSYIITKFSTNPAANTENTYDPRLDVAILRPTNADMSKYEEKMAAYEADPTLPKPLQEYEFEFFLNAAEESVRGIKRKFDVNDPEHDDENLYDYEDGEGRKGFKYARLRPYETYQQAGDADDAYGDTVALALHDPELDVAPVDGAQKRLKKGAYYYPIQQRTHLRPKRKGPGALSQVEQEGEQIDALHVTIRDADEDETARRLAARAKLDNSVQQVEAQA